MCVEPVQPCAVEVGEPLGNLGPGSWGIEQLDGVGHRGWDVIEEYPTGALAHLKSVGAAPEGDGGVAQAKGFVVRECHDYELAGG